ncbi:MAG: undecaprenyl/decaprenyl-phosphate alpha-N-acetylglucosaminyl 1-phosphate transferase, partial [Bacteroidaceae bacterium]|nr:undecaprenyl/decaprenyl-phosphate alpha-N-acetylglucosaminyl 1-phosphate transferase [Bacteroidaceae bacterium]
YKAKFFAQVLCGVMLVAGGIWLDSLHGVLWIHEVPRWIGYPLTVLLTVFIINAVNLIDGIDGLASGLSGIACLFYGVFFFILQNYVYALLAFATLGVLVPFHYYNVWGDPLKRRKIFMGDTGSLTIGLMLSVLSIKLVTCVPEDASEINTIILAFSPLLVPGFDVVRVYFHRVRNGKNPFLPDKNHIHHRMLAVGMTQRTAMVTIVFLSMLFIVCNVLLSKRVSVTFLFLWDVLLWIAVNMWLTHKIGQKNKKL